MISRDVLRRYPYFAQVGDESLEAVAAISEERMAASGEVLFIEDQAATHLLVLAEGEVEIRYRLGNDEQVTVDVLEPGDLMVWSALVGPHRTHSTAVAVTDARLIAIEGAGLRALIRKDAVLGYDLMSHLATAVSERLQGARVRLAAIA